MIAKFGQDRARIRILDYGGGNGLLAERLRAAGFLHVQTHDPFMPQFSARPDTKFDLITSYEKFEHLADPLPVLDVLVDLFGAGRRRAVLDAAAAGGIRHDRHDVVVYRAEERPYLSLYSARALAVAWQRHGFTVSSFNPNLHLAFRDTA